MTPPGKVGLRINMEQSNIMNNKAPPTNGCLTDANEVQIMSKINNIDGNCNARKCRIKLGALSSKR